MILHYSGRLGHDGVEEEPTEHEDFWSLIESLVDSGDTPGETVAVEDDGRIINITTEVSHAMEAEREHLNNYKPVQGRPPV